MATIYKPIITRIDTKANWTTLNPVPANGEQCIEILGGGLFKLKIGDGVTPWLGLNYYTSSGGSSEDLSKLITPDKSSLVGAINSVQRQINDLVASLAGLADVARTGNYNDLINKLVAGDGIKIDENNVISTTGGPTPPTPTVYEEYFPETEQLLIHGVIVVSDEDGDLVLDGVNGEIIPIYDEEGDPVEHDDGHGDISYYNDVIVVSDTNEDLVLEGVNGNFYPKDVDIETSNIPGDETTSEDQPILFNNTSYNVISDDDGNIVLGDPTTGA